MKKSARIYRDAVAVFIAAALVACSGGFHTAGLLVPGDGSPRHAMSWGLATTQPIVQGTMVIPLTLSLSGSVGTFSAFGTTQCAAASGTNPCPNIAYAASPPSWVPPADSSLTFTSSSLNVACASSCYVVAYENGAGPYLVQGPGSASSSTSVAFGSETVARYFLGGATYSFFLAHVTAVNTPPPPPTPSPSPVPTATPSACATSTPTGGEEDDVRYAADDGDESGSCATPSPRPTATCGTEDSGTSKNRHGDGHIRNKQSGDDDECDDD
jgi:hypothetical protein